MSALDVTASVIATALAKTFALRLVTDSPPPPEDFNLATRIAQRAYDLAEALEEESKRRHSHTRRECR